MTRLHFIGIILIISGLVFPAYIFSQNRAGDGSASMTIPESLRRPMRTEASRYPRDTIIGELGQGTAPERAWRYAREIAAALLGRNQNYSGISRGDNDILKEYFPVLGSFDPRRYHLGGGRTEVDGSVSFLVRFLGRDKWIAGEIYLKVEGNNWRLDDLVLEEVRSMEEGKSSYKYDFTPYERFF